MTPSRRAALADVRPTPTTHRGLWLERYVASTDDAEAKWGLIREVAQREEDPDYRAYFAGVRKALEELGADLREAETRGRLVVGLGSETVLENGIALHRTYGVPVIPGSALKGLMSHFVAQWAADEAWARRLDGKSFFRGEAQRALFGSPDAAGIIVVFDALPVPGRWRLEVDVITSHHPAYYAGHGVPPADWDAPNPVPFLSATGTFLLALWTPPGAEPWREVAWDILARALQQAGVGAKTALGYGRMRLEPAQQATRSQSSSQPTSAQPPRSAELEAVLRRIGGLRPRDFAGQGPQVVEQIQRLSPEERRIAARALWDKVSVDLSLRRKEWFQWLRREVEP